MTLVPSIVPCPSGDWLRAAAGTRWFLLLQFHFIILGKSIPFTASVPSPKRRTTERFRRDKHGGEFSPKPGKSSLLIHSSMFNASWGGKTPDPNDLKERKVYHWSKFQPSHRALLQACREVKHHRTKLPISWHPNSRVEGTPQWHLAGLTYKVFLHLPTIPRLVTKLPTQSHWGTCKITITCLCVFRQ